MNISSAIIVPLLIGFILQLTALTTFAEQQLTLADIKLGSEQQSLINHLQRLSSPEFNGRKTGTLGHTKTQQYIASVFSKISTVELTSKQSLNALNSMQKQKFKYQHAGKIKQGTNFIYRKRGNHLPNSVVVITAHYDHLGAKSGKVYYGADDNASGTAILLQLKEWLEQQSLRHSVILVATDAEEDGLYGANAFVNADEYINLPIALNINLDMVGYGHNRKSLFVVGLNRNPKLKPIINKLNAEGDLKFIAKNFLRVNRNSINNRRINLHTASDHYEFHKKGIPYLFITGDNHRYYHSYNDTFEKIDKKFYNNVYIALKKLIKTVDSEIN